MTARTPRWRRSFSALSAASLLALPIASIAQPRHAAITHAHPQFGIASVYARMLHGRRTASGEQHDGDDYTAAHRTLPLGTMVRVTNLANHLSVIVRINDRGPRLTSRVIDLSPGAAAQIGLRAKGRGIARVRLDVIDDAPAQHEQRMEP